MAHYLKYHLFEAESLKDIYRGREIAKGSYLRNQQALSVKKEKLFKLKDISKWGLSREDLSNINDITSDKDKAFKLMLPTETRALEENRDYLAFLSNQCLTEVKRVTNDNHTLIKDHYLKVASLMCELINKQHVVWADLITHFADYDESYTVNTKQQYVESTIYKTQSQSKQI